MMSLAQVADHVHLAVAHFFRQPPRTHLNFTGFPILQVFTASLRAAVPLLCLRLSLLGPATVTNHFLKRGQYWRYILMA